MSSEHPKNEGIAPRKRRFVVVIAGGVAMVELWLDDCGVGSWWQAASGSISRLAVQLLGLFNVFFV